jgi:hypothetical protein
VDVTELYTLNATVDWVGNLPGAGSSIAFVEISDNSSMTPVTLRRADQDASDQGSESASTTPFFLLAGVPFRLQARAFITGGDGTAGSSFSATAAWNFQLVSAVPETGSAMMMMPIALLTASIAWWKYWRNRLESGLTQLPS